MKQNLANAKPRTLLVLPNDPLIAYSKKGEVKKRYYNPENYFDRIAVADFSPEPVDVDQIKTVFGNAEIKYLNIPVLFPITKPLKFYRMYKNLLNWAQSINPDCIRAYNCDLLGWVGQLLAKRLNIPFVLSNHCDPEELSKDLSKDFKTKFWWFFSKIIYEPNAIRNATAIINVTRFLNSYCKKKGASDEQLHVIYNKVYTDQFKSERNFSKKDDFHILTIGKICSQKDQATIIKALGLLHNCQLTIIGNGPDYDKKLLHDLVSELKLSNQVSFVEKVNHSQIQDYYKKADIFALSSHFEGFCIPVLEAMAASLPVVVNDKEPLPEVLGGTGIVVKQTPHEFANAIKDLIADANFRKELSEKAFSRAKTLDGTIMENKEKELYQSIIEKYQGAH